MDAGITGCFMYMVGCWGILAMLVSTSTIGLLISTIFASGFIALGFGLIIGEKITEKRLNNRTK